MSTTLCVEIVELVRMLLLQVSIQLTTAMCTDQWENKQAPKGVWEPGPWKLSFPRPSQLCLRACSF